MKKTARKGDVKVRAKAKPPKPPKPQKLEARVAALEAAVAALQQTVPSVTRTSGGEDVETITGRIGGSVPLEQKIQAEQQSSVQEKLGEKS